MTRLLTVIAAFCWFASTSEIGSVHASILVDGSFERGTSLGDGFPSSFGHWSGNVASVVRAENGVRPFHGSGMLRFDSAIDQPGGASTARSSQLWQLIDLTPFQAHIQSGNVVVVASGWFNRVLGDAQTDANFQVNVAARAGSPSTFVWDDGNALATSHAGLQSDSDVSSWEYIEATLQIPSNASYLALQISTFEDVFNDTSGIEFDGHYADAIGLSMSKNGVPIRPIPEPVSLLVWLGLGVAVIARQLLLRAA